MSRTCSRPSCTSRRNGNCTHQLCIGCCAIYQLAYDLPCNQLDHRNRAATIPLTNEDEPIANEIRNFFNGIQAAPQPPQAIPFIGPLPAPAFAQPQIQAPPPQLPQQIVPQLAPEIE